ncbi:Hypothetical predicted protein [Mytilus galloprovincialis]|uniref:Uncharacterized protein n=1 Tax=Mytilus galloprovincialis TaxID=29158 RepID=A0A8B6EX13_MYTGA|nr:Hypothetical predicted protein [Mytilus galloprovincialis]
MVSYQHSINHGLPGVKIPIYVPLQREDFMVETHRIESHVSIDHCSLNINTHICSTPTRGISWKITHQDESHIQPTYVVLLDNEDCFMVDGSHIRMFSIYILNMLYS